MKLKLGIVLMALSGVALASTTVGYVEHNGSVRIKANAYESMQNIQATKFVPATPESKAIKSEAVRIGAQYGFADESQRLQKEVETKVSQLDKIYDFGAVMQYANPNSAVINLLPPVIVLSNNYVQSGQDGRYLKISNNLYRIVRNAKIVTATPSWRDYLIMPVYAPNQPVKSLLPKNAAEKKIWKAGFKLGWGIGVKQADAEMTTRVHRLGRDFNGMLNYLILYKKGQVSSPYVAYKNTPVIGGKKEVSINNQIYQITAPAQLNTNVQSWQVTPEEKIKQHQKGN